MPAFEREPLWLKSRVLIDRALRGRDNRDYFEFYIWAVVALELLGKAALAGIHPSLVADPSHFPSLLASSWPQASTTTFKSITAKTLYERLRLIVPGFDEPMKREALLMAERRNAEIHSGEAPTQGLDPDVWVPAFWKAANTLLMFQGATLEEWLGREEGTRIRVVLSDAAALGEQSVRARIARHQAAWDANHPIGSQERVEATAQAMARPIPPRYYHTGDAHEESTCPACQTKAWLFGYEIGEEITGNHLDEDGYVEFVRKEYSAEEFRCPQCGLTLEGVDEIAYTDLPPEFWTEDIREPDYEPDYGND